MFAELRDHLRKPFLTLLALLALLSVNVLLGLFFVSGHAWIAEGLIAATMVAIVILFAMETLDDPPITRLFTAIGFFWVLMWIVLPFAPLTESRMHPMLAVGVLSAVGLAAMALTRGAKSR